MSNALKISNVSLNKLSKDFLIADTLIDDKSDKFKTHLSKTKLFYSVQGLGWTPWS